MKGLLVSAVFVGVLGQLVGCTGDEDLTFNRAMELYKPDTLDVIQLHEARDLLAALDDANHPEGEYMLAMMYQRGDGVPADQDKALKLFLESSNHGNGDASAVASTFFDYRLSEYPQEYRATLAELLGDSIMSNSSEPKTSLPLDLNKANELIKKSVRRDSDYGRYLLGRKMLLGIGGVKKDVVQSIKILSDIDDQSPYALHAALFLSDAYLIEGYSTYSIDKAIAMHRKLANNGDLVSTEIVAGAYLGKLGSKVMAELSDPVKYAELIKEIESRGDSEAYAIAISASFIRSDLPYQNLMRELVARDDINPYFAYTFCTKMSKNYISSISTYDQQELIKACMYGAEANQSTHQIVLSGSYFGDRNFKEAYKWALIASANGLPSGHATAQIIEPLLSAKEIASIREQAALKFNELFYSPAIHSRLEDLEFPWYPPGKSRS